MPGGPHGEHQCGSGGRGRREGEPGARVLIRVSVGDARRGRENFRTALKKWLV